MDFTICFLYEKKMYIKNEHRITSQQLEEVLETLKADENIHLDVILMVHHVYHQMDADYEGGLNLLDKLHQKLANYFEEAANWDVTEIKSIVRESGAPAEEFYTILQQMLTPEMIAVYGL